MMILNLLEVILLVLKIFNCDVSFLFTFPLYVKWGMDSAVYQLPFPKDWISVLIKLFDKLIMAARKLKWVCLTHVIPAKLIQ